MPRMEGGRAVLRGREINLPSLLIEPYPIASEEHASYTGEILRKDHVTQLPPFPAHQPSSPDPTCSSWSSDLPSSMRVAAVSLKFNFSSLPLARLSVWTQEFKIHEGRS